MPVERYTFAAGTEADWALETTPLAVGQPGWATDSRTFKVGDGNTLWPALLSPANPDVNGATIDDTQATLQTVWSSQQTQSQDTVTLQAAQSYTDKQVQQIGPAANAVYAVLETSPGVYPNRPSVPLSTVVLFLGTVAPTAGVMGPNDIFILKG